MKNILYIIAITALYISCSEDKEQDNVSAEKETLTTAKLNKSEVPRDRIFYSTFSRAGQMPLNDFIELYKQDIATAEESYATNLKNMWFAVVKNKLVTEGTEEQKLFFINEQAALENNLAFFTDFYNLLASSKVLSSDEKEKTANAFYKKNMIAINDVQWTTPEEKKLKETELTYAKRNFTILANSQK